MIENSRWNLDEADKEKLISALTPELTILRVKAEISQGELANLIGVSRQTYGAIERGARQMTWNTYLSLILSVSYTHLFLLAGQLTETKYLAPERSRSKRSFLRCPEP